MTGESVTLDWQRPEHALLFGVYRDRVQLGHTLLSFTTFRGLRCGTTYSLGVNAVSI